MVMAAGQPSSACAFSPLASRPSSYRLAAFYKLSCAARISSSSSSSFGFLPCIGGISVRTSRRSVVVKASGSSASRWQDWWRLPPPPPAEKGGALASAPSISDVLWPSAGAFLAMALLGRLDQIMTPKGVSFTIAPLGAVCAVLYATPNAPAARKYNMFVAQIACAAFGVLALSIFGPGWLARSTALAVSIAFMIVTRSTHPPAASLPILFIDGAKFHQLQFWYMLFPGAAGCLLLCFIQEMVSYLKSNYRF